MIPLIMNTKGSIDGALTYSERKCNRGLASPISARNVYVGGRESHSLFAIRNEFDRYINNPAIRNNVRNILFHFTINPASNDPGTESQVCEFIYAYLDSIGFSDQPTAIFRHEDIERIHYHVVTPKINASGRMIYKGSFDYLDLISFAKEHGAEYGLPFADGAESLPLDRNVAERMLFSPASQNKRESMRYLMGEALKFNYASESEFRDVMRSMGVDFSHRPRTKHGEGEYLLLRGRFLNGGTNTRAVNVGARQGDELFSQFISNMGANMKRQPVDIVDDVISDAAMCKVLFELSRNAEEFRRMARQVGIHVRFHRERPEKWNRPIEAWESRVPKPGETLTPIRSVTFVDKKRHRIVTNEYMEQFFPISTFIEAERTGRWSSVFTGFPGPKALLSAAQIDRINEENGRMSDEYNRMLLEPERRPAIKI